ncbi:MAG: hypothetical protein QM817_14040 [Archangium sp.]
MLLVTYADAGALAVANQATLISRLEEKRGPVAIIFDVHDAVRSVPMDVPTFWLSVTGRRELEIRAMAIVTHHAAVRVAASGFGLANKVRGVATKVDTFATVPSAVEWAAQTNRLDSDSAR